MKDNSAFTLQYEEYLGMIQEALQGLLLKTCPQEQLLDAMRYSLLAGGKRIRPVLTLAFCRAAGGQPERALPYACAVEMLHTYSLIHDDLPCMDDDVLRRGKPTCHVVYGECTAVLAGDALQAEAFGQIAGAACLPESRAAACGVLAEAAGAYGMCGGQYLDMTMEGQTHTQEDLRLIHDQKTAALLVAACRLGVLAAECTADNPAYLAATAYAAHLGMAFQIRDDILDATASDDVLGKPAGSDERNGKHTFFTLLGGEACNDLVMQYTAQAKQALSALPVAADFLAGMADMLGQRDH
ncbi:MAG: polyprenyl synthetase family protein [Oscillospiraceae bacterium]|nr:polyprenyl synthetase family protein [Oscillospiraceae bacterium]